MAADPNDIMLMARTMWGENNNATADEYAAIAHTMRNRLQSGDPQYSSGASGQLGSGNSMSRIILAPHQFQAWDDPKAKNYPMNAPLRSPAFQSAYRIAADVLSGQSDDLTHGAVNYYNPKAPGQKTPAWAKGREGQQIGSHKFYGPQKSKDAYADLMEGAPGEPKQAPAQSASAEGGAPSANYKPTTQDKHADLMEGAPPEPSKPPPEAPQPTTVAESIAQSRQQGRGIPATFQDAMQTLIRRHPVAATTIGGAAAATTGIPLLGAAAMGVNALPYLGQAALGYGAYKIGETAGVPQAVGSLWDIVRQSVPH